MDQVQRLKACDRRDHDISNSIRTLKLVLEELEDGYRFDDEDAPENIRLFRQAVMQLEYYLSQGGDFP